MRRLRGNRRRRRPRGARGRGPPRRLHDMRRHPPERPAARRAAPRGDVRGHDVPLRLERPLARPPLALRARRRHDRGGPARGARAAPRVRRAGGARIPRARSPGEHPLGRRDAAPAPERAARQRPDGRALRARRAHHRPASERHAAAAPQPAQPGGHGLDGPRGRARRGDHPRRRSRDRSRTGRRAQRRPRRLRRTGGGGPLRPAVADRACAAGDGAHRASETPDGGRLDRAERSPGAQPPRRDLPGPGRAHVCRGGREWVRQVHARASGVLPGAAARAEARGAAAGGVRLDQGDQGGEARARRRPVAHRENAAQRARHVPRGVGRHAQALRVAAGGQDARLHTGAVLVQQRERRGPVRCL